MSANGFYYSSEHDVNDGKEWSEMDVFDLKASLASDETLEANTKQLRAIAPTPQAHRANISSFASHGLVMLTNERGGSEAEMSPRRLKMAKAQVFTLMSTRPRRSSAPTEYRLLGAARLDAKSLGQ